MLIRAFRCISPIIPIPSTIPIIPSLSRAVSRVSCCVRLLGFLSSLCSTSIQFHLDHPVLLKYQCRFTPCLPPSKLLILPLLHVLQLLHVLPFLLVNLLPVHHLPYLHNLFHLFHLLQVHLFLPFTPFFLFPQIPPWPIARAVPVDRTSLNVLELHSVQPLH